MFYKVETYLDRLLVLEKYVIPNFVKIVRVVLEFTRVVFTDRQTGRQATGFFTRLRAI